MGLADTGRARPTIGRGPMLGRPVVKTRVILERHAAVADAADKPRLLEVMLRDGISVLGQGRTYVRISVKGLRSRLEPRPLDSIRFRPCQTNI